MQRTRFFLFLFFSLLLSTAPSFADPKKVGVSIPLSGFAAPYGAAFEKGLRMFKEEHPESAEAIEIIIDDSAYDGARVVSSVRKLAQVDKASLVLVWGNTPSEIVAAMAGQLGVPVLLVCMDPRAKGRPSVASFDLPLSRFQGIMKQIIDVHGIKRLGIVAANIGNVLEFIELVRPTLPPPAYEELMPTDALDFRSTISKIRSKPVDAILLMLTPEQTGLFAEQAAAQEYRARVISGDMLADDDLRAKVKSGMGAVTYMYGGADKEFRERYRKRFGDTSHLFEAATGYAFGVTMLALKDKLGASDPETFVKGLPGVSIPASPVGPIRFESTPDRGMRAELPTVYYDE